MLSLRFLPFQALRTDTGGAGKKRGDVGKEASEQIWRLEFKIGSPELLGPASALDPSPAGGRE